MRRSTVLIALTATLMVVFTGCQSHEATVSNLQSEYDRLAKQFQQDCSGEYLDVPPKVSDKCKDEDSKMKAAWDRLQAERSKK